MNTENFKEFLENPSRLYQLSYQELKSLVLQYPYSTNLHYLLLQKSAMEDHREFEQNRQRAATYSINRTFLFQLLHELASADKKEPVLQLDEEFLELKDLSLIEVDKPPLAVADDMLEAPASAPSLSDLPPLDMLTTDIEEETEELDLSQDSIHAQKPELALDLTKEEEFFPQDGADINLSEPSPSIPFYQAPDRLIAAATTLPSIVKRLNIPIPEIEEIPVSTIPAAPTPVQSFQAPAQLMRMTATLAAVVNKLNIPITKTEEIPVSEPPVQSFRASEKLIDAASSIAIVLSQLSIPKPETKRMASQKVIPQVLHSTTSFQAPHQLIRAAASIAGLVSQPGFQTPKVVDASSWTIEPPAPVLETDEVSPSLQKQKQLLNKLDILLTERKAATQPQKPSPRPKRSFTSWVHQFQSEPVKDQLGDLMEAKKREELKRLKKMQKKAKKKKKKADRHIIKFAEQSLTKHKAIISETLAEILAEQGEIEKSLQMYERLKLFFPEKSAYFAAIIEKLKTD